MRTRYSTCRTGERARGSDARFFPTRGWRYPIGSLLRASGEKILREERHGRFQWRTTMVISKAIAGLIGPTLVAIAAALLLNLGSISAVLEPLSRDPALVLIYGMLLFVAGLAIVRVHNRWAADWSILVTICPETGLFRVTYNLVYPVGYFADLAASVVLMMST